ncbi:hypothetical protein EZS27_025802 [termite gut metagenome]|uniref:Uncharacterized protein n=1 Tax=termite gut metagenome TaxID=433724 RepID=A0A5J4QUV4_9ZZZZ
MANSDLLVKLGLQNEEFIKALDESKKQIAAMKQKTDAASSSIQSFNSKFKSISSQIFGVTAALGIAKGSVDMFNKAIMSTQNTGDKFVRITDQAKASVDSFFVSLNTGNISGFLSNLSNVIDRAGKLADIMDELGTKKMFSSIELNDLQTKFTILANKASDKSKSPEERNEALKGMKGVLTDEKNGIISLTKNLAEEMQEAVYEQVRDGLAKQGYKNAGELSKERIDELLKESSRESNQKLSKVYGKP